MDCMMPPDFAGNPTGPLYRRCQDVLLQVGAWEALLRLKDRIKPAAACPPLPVHRYYAYLGAPNEAIEALLTTAGRLRDRLRLTARDGLALGSLAVHAGMTAQSAEWFRFALQSEPVRIDAAAGLAFANSLLAERHLPERLTGAILQTGEEERLRQAIRSFLIPG